MHLRINRGSWTILRRSCMARTSTRRWKGCPMCKYWKFAGFGDAVRVPPRVLRQLGGRTRRVSRHDVSSGE